MIKKFIVGIITVAVGIKVLNDVLYYYYMMSGQKLKAFFVRPYYYVWTTGVTK